MTYSWTPIESGKDTFKSMCNHKVVHVVESKELAANGYYCRWHGELDNGKYFSVQVLSGIVMANMVDRENELAINTTPIYYVKESTSTVESFTDVNMLFGLSLREANFLSKFTKELQFDEIMQLFMWEYVSTNVEIYETIFV